MAFATTFQAADLLVLDAVLPTIDQSLCCCSLLDPQLAPQQHLDDCILHLMDPALHLSLPDESSSGKSSPSEDHNSARRRKHRESMARLRLGWRASISTLEREERQLQSALRRALRSPSPIGKQPMHPLEALRESYRGLVEEQHRLERERANLEAAQAHNDKFQRLLDRGLDQTRLFRVTPGNTPDA